MKTIANGMWVGMAALLALGSPAWGEPGATGTEAVISECTGHCGVDSQLMSIKVAAEPSTELPVARVRDDNTKPEQTPMVGVTPDLKGKNLKSEMRDGWRENSTR